MVTEAQRSAKKGGSGRRLGHRSRKKTPLWVGLTGSLASGKSTSLKAFRKLGWTISSADEIVARIYQKEGLTKEEILKRFGQSSAGLKKLERWIHPLVKDEIFKVLKASKKPCVVEVPLLFEAKFDQYFDCNIFIFAPLKDRLKRVRKRGMDLKLFRFLESKQFSPAVKANLSHFILLNSSKAQLKKQVKVLSRILLNIEKN